MIRKKYSHNWIKKKIVVAYHAFSDAPHGDGVDMIFTDYYAHAKETLNFLKTNYNKNTLYLIKPHPTRFLYNEHGLFENLFEKLFQNCLKNFKTFSKKFQNIPKCLKKFKH